MLNELALRLAAVQALAPWNATTWPTIAGRMVFDNGAPVQGLEDANSELIWISVQSGDLNVKPSENNRDFTLSAETEHSLTLEMCLAPAIPDDAQSFKLFRYALGRLSLLQSQAYAALANSRRYGGIMSKVVIHFRELKSELDMDADLDRPVFIKRLEIVCRIKNEGEPNFAGTGLAILPDPLRLVALDLPAGSPGHALALEIAGLLTQPAAPQELLSLDFEATLRGQTETEIPAATGRVTL